jgi:hypothetical protein
MICWHTGLYVSRCFTKVCLYTDAHSSLFVGLLDYWILIANGLFFTLLLDFYE